MKTILWLDDIRNPEIGDWKFLIQYIVEEYLEEERENVDVVWVKTYEKFCDYIEANEMPDFVCFDNDLGTIMSGYDCAKFLVNYCIDYNKKLPQWYVQSMNPVAREYIDDLLTNFKKSQRDPQE